MENKKAFSGTGRVFGFTLKQLFSSKANIVALVLMFVLSFVSVPGILIVSGDGFGSSDGETVEIRLDDSTGLVSEEELAEASGGKVTFSDEADVCFRIGNDGEEYTVDVTAPEYSQNVDDICNDIYEIISEKVSGISPEASKALNKSSVFDYGTLGDDSFSTEYGIQTVSSIIVMIVSVFASSYIIRAVVEEKSSRLVETLTVSVGPMALMLGKILAVLVYVALIFALIIIGFLMSYALFGMFTDLSMIKEFIDEAKEMLTCLSVGSLATVFVSVVLGVLAFSLISAVAGAGCSSTEDISGANGTPMIIVMACYMISLLVGSFVSDSALRIMSVIPFLSSFIAPVQYLNGNLSAALLVLSWVVQAVTCLALLYFCAKVHRDLLFHNGARISFSGAIKMSLGTKAEKEGKGE